MENLFCDEVWLMSPDRSDRNDVKEESIDGFLYWTREDCEEAFGVLLEKEDRYMPQKGYFMLLQSNHLIHNARFKAVKWFIQSRVRMNLSFETVFGAMNYLDRFISLTQCPEWSYWMFELLSIACLSVASKFNETTTIPLHEFQVEGLDHWFAPQLIQRMELTLLKALGWRMDCTTPFSYIELLTHSIDFQSFKKSFHGNLSSAATELLLKTLPDSKFTEFRPCVLAVAAVRALYEGVFPPVNNNNNNASFDNLLSIIPREYKEDLIKCQIMVAKYLSQNHLNVLTCGISSNYAPSSPVTVLKMECCNIFDCGVDRSILKMSAGINIHWRSRRKRKRAEI